LIDQTRALPSMTAAFDLQTANGYLGLARKSTWLLQPGCPVARCDMRRPGARRPLWRWRKETLDKFLVAREVVPGAINHQEYS
jgi:hypothetical protein